MNLMHSATTLHLTKFKHRAVRDLAWVIASPPLITGQIKDVKWWSHDNCQAEFIACLPALIELDKNPAPLNLHLEQLKNLRLGSIFEGFISFWLTISPNFECLYQNLQIIEDKHTYGEIDFIIKELDTEKVIHLEVAVKFYLGAEPYQDAFRWFGTNTKDQLGKKFQHLCTQQTQLSKNQSEKLRRYCKHVIDERHCIIKGRLFYPKDSETAPINTPLAKNHLRGRWYFVDQEDIPSDVIKINKSKWLAEFDQTDIEQAKPATKTSIQKIDRAECFVEFTKKNKECVEKERLFFLPRQFTFPSD